MAQRDDKILGGEGRDMLGGWSGKARAAAERIADYDWDRSIRAASAEISALIAGQPFSQT